MDLSLIVVTDRHLARRPLLDVVAAALEGGARTFLLREKDLPSSQRYELADAMRALGADVIVAGTDPLGGNAIHLAAADPFPAPMAAPLASGRPLERSGPGASGGPLRRSAPIGSGWRPSPGGPLGLSGWTEIGRSCHAVDEVAALEWETYCTLSPIFATASKPGYGPALGTAAIERALVSRPRKAASRARGTATLAGGSVAGEVAGTLAGGSAAGEVAGTLAGDSQAGEVAAALAGGEAGGRRVVALGGVDTPQRAYECRAAGATGVAVMGAVMRADDPASVVKGLLP